MRKFVVLAISLVALGIAPVLSGVGSSAVRTDQEDYSPGSVVTISGDNSNGAGYLAGETVHVDVSGPNDYSRSCEAIAVADDDGQVRWSCTVTLVDGPDAVGQYEYTATGFESGVTENGTFTDAGFFLRAMIQGTSTPLAVPFVGGTVTTSSIKQFGRNPPGTPNTTCAGTALGFLAAGTTITTATVNNPPSITNFFTNLVGGFGTLGTTAMPATSSNLLTAPPTVSSGGQTYAFSNWAVVNSSGGSTGLNGSIVSTSGTSACFSGWNAPIGPTFVQANYVLAQGTLVVNKSLADAAGKTGNKTAPDFQFDVAGTTTSSNVAFEADTSNSLTVTPASDYNVTEDPRNGYTPSYSNCGPNLSVTAGGTTTCTITNTFNGYASSTSSSLDTASFTIGGSVTDTAEVTGDADGGDPGGSVKFFVCGPVDPSGSYPDCSSDISNLVATDTTATAAGTNKSSFSSGTFTPTAAGKYCFRAEYQGSSLYLGSSDYDSSECFLVKGTLDVNKTLANDAGKTGNKTAADFQFDVAGPTPSSNVAFESDGSNSLTVDAGSYTVTEDAENGYTPSYLNCTSVTVTTTAGCTIMNTFNGYTSTTTTQVGTAPITLGGSISDTATVTGDADGGDPGGTVDFYLCGPTDPSLAYAGCATGGTLVKDDASLTSDGVAGTFTSTASSGSITPTAAGKYCFRAEYGGSSLYKGDNDDGTNECFLVNPASSTVVYTGLFDGVGGTPTSLTATVTSSYQNCAKTRTVTFDLDGATYDNTATAATGSSTTGSYTGTASTTKMLQPDAYDVTASVADKDLGSDGITDCSEADSDAAILMVAEPGSDAQGGGWYKVTGASPPRVNFGFAVKKQRDDSYKGQLLWMNNEHYKLKGSITGYGTITCPNGFVVCGVATGAGTLYEWNGTDWANPQAVSFSAKFYDGGQTSCSKKSCVKQERPDNFGMQISPVSITPESTPQTLWGGSIHSAT